MNSNVYVLMLLLIPFWASSQIETAITNGNVKEEILAAKTAGADFRQVTLFNNLTANETTAISRANSNVKGALFFNYEKPTILNRASANKQYLSLDIPSPQRNGNLKLELTKVDIHTSDFKTNVPYTPGLHYRGIVQGVDKSLASLSIFDDEVIGFVKIDGQTFTLGKLKSTDKVHVLYDEFQQGWPLERGCDTPDDAVTYHPSELEGANSRAAGDCVRQKFEIDESLTNQIGGVAQATSYGTGLFNNQATLCANDGISLTLSELIVWSNANPAPYIIDQYNTLNSYRALTGAFNGDVAYLGFYQGGWGGGVASSIGGICPGNPDDSKAIGGHIGFFNSLPTYSHDVLIISHEVGHLLGARHTHACVWNGNNTAIDGCSGFTEGNCPLPPAPSVGTIMSYCNTADFNEGFHPQVAQAIRNYIATRTCTSPCGSTPTCTDGVQNGDETGVDCGGTNCPPCSTCTDGIQNGNETGVDCGGSCPPCVTCNDGIQNGDETGVDCGGLNCPPCAPCSLNTVTLTLVLDDYPEETSWDIQTASGQVVASSNGTYANQVDGATVVVNNCLPDGCYTFTISDTYGDGICCQYGQGSYLLLDGNGNTLAAGGAFAFSESTSFCFNGPPPTTPYCDATGNSTVYEWIERITFGTIDNTSGSNQGYADFTVLSTPIVAGSSVKVGLYPGFPNNPYREYWNIWIDLNQDGDFEDAGEMVAAANSNGPIVGNISIPASAIPGATRMRVAMRYNQSAAPCGSFDYGEVEDYTVVVAASYANFNGETPPSSLSEIPSASSKHFQVYPNPASDRIHIDYASREGGDLSVEVMSLTGQLLISHSEAATMGTNRFLLKTDQLPAGVYLIRLQNGQQQSLERLTITR